MSRTALATLSQTPTGAN
ncbi:MAG TPA: DUF1586 domain-containing protein, partial [Rhodopirellula baltica]|nr:DUF1586 domain-containing protein [Rhodopirellula baltica]